MRDDFSTVWRAVVHSELQRFRFELQVQIEKGMNEFAKFQQEASLFAKAVKEFSRDIVRHEWLPFADSYRLFKDIYHDVIGFKDKGHYKLDNRQYANLVDWHTFWQNEEYWLRTAYQRFVEDDQEESAITVELGRIQYNRAMTDDPVDPILEYAIKGKGQRNIVDQQAQIHINDRHRDVGKGKGGNVRGRQNPLQPNLDEQIPIQHAKEREMLRGAYGSMRPRSMRMASPCSRTLWSPTGTIGSRLTSNILTKMRIQGLATQGACSARWCSCPMGARKSLVRDVGTISAQTAGWKG